MKRKRVIMAKLSRLKDADRDFDHAYWEKIGPAGILAAMWEMIYEYHRLRGDYVRQPRLRRSVEVVMDLKSMDNWIRSKKATLP